MKYWKFLANLTKSRLKVSRCLKNKEFSHEDFITSNFSDRNRFSNNPLGRRVIKWEQSRSMRRRDVGIFYSTRRAANRK